MAEVTLRIGGRDYRVDCREGEVARVSELGRMIAARADKLGASLGAMGEARLLVSAAILIADELAEAEAALEAAATRAEALAEALENSAPTP